VEVNVNHFDVGAHMEKLNELGREAMKRAKAQVIEANSHAPAVTKAEAETQTGLQAENKT
jgi:hypothetical protein